MQIDGGKLSGSGEFPRDYSTSAVTLDLMLASLFSIFLDYVQILKSSRKPNYFTDFRTKQNSGFSVGRLR